ncbi:RraA family protein [Saccharopolyspora shandongensis]|uniref:RraA family protein n=1 Tax=Saccharopolyspora shandongensis TaxID=418495 RepID=UPI0033FE50BD
MDNDELARRCTTLTSAHLADACLRTNVPVRCAPASVRPTAPGARVTGRARPARHAGSVDVFLEAIEHAAPGDVLVVDNGGRADEACVGDLLVLEAQAAGLAGLVIWGLHRDSADLRAISLPVFSTGAIPTGPQRLDESHPEALRSATVGEWLITDDDLVIGDDDGVLFLPTDTAEEIIRCAETIRDTERHQAQQIRDGIPLRHQLRFDTYLAQREQTPSLTFRAHLRAIGGAIEQ